MTINTITDVSAGSGRTVRELSMYPDGRVELDGTTVEGNGMNSYSAALATLAEHAAREGTHVLVRGIDHSNGVESWFTVDANNNTRVVEKPEATATTTAPAREPVQQQPTVTQAPAPAKKTVISTASEGTDVVPAPATAPVKVPHTAPPAEAQPATQSTPPPAVESVPQFAPAVDAETRAEPQSEPSIEAGRRFDIVPSQDPEKLSSSPPALTTLAAEWVTAPDALPRRADVRFVRPVKERPRAGLRGALYSMTGGAVNLGPSTQEQEEEALVRRISRQLHGNHTTAFLSLKGGIGKTSTTTGVGMIMAEYRGDPPCVIDANPDAGDLAERVLGEELYDNATPRTITDIVRDLSSIDSLTKLSTYMHHANRLHVIAGEQDPALSDALTAEHYLNVQSLVANYYSVILTDCGTGVSHPAMAGVLSTASNLVIASGYAVSGAKRAKATIEWLAAHGYEHLASNAVVVVTDKDQVSNRVDRRAIEDHLAGAAKTLVTVPHDRGVADGDQINLEHISRATRGAYMKIAAAIVDGYQ